MRTLLLSAASLLVMLTGATGVPAEAQVRVDPQALGPAPAKPAPRPRPAKAARAPVAAPAPVASPPPAPVMPAVPAYAPEVPVIPPPIEVATRPAAPVVPAVVTADAPGAATKLGEGGLRVSFGVGRSDLNPASEAALKAFAKALPPDQQITLTAFAPAAGEDRSLPRRLSLARALTVRSVLLGEGIASPRVIVRALGGVPGVAGDAPDRVDLVPGPPGPMPIVAAKQAP